MGEIVLHTPTHPGEFAVEFSPGDYASSLKSLNAFTAGEVMAYVKGTTKAAKSYSTVQHGSGIDDNIELNSDLVYINHSCDPNVAFDLSSSDQSEWHLRALKDIHPGDYLAFFYPSSEWDMAQSFNCRCKEPVCLGTVQGAKYLSEDVLLAKGYVSPWVLQMVRERDAKAAEATFYVVPPIRHMVQA